MLPFIMSRVYKSLLFCLLSWQGSLSGRLKGSEKTNEQNLPVQHYYGSLHKQIKGDLLTVSNAHKRASQR